MSVSSVRTQDEPLWRPSPERVRKSQLTEFMSEANRRHGLKLDDYRALHAWSVSQMADFWELVWDFCGLVGEKGERRLVDGNDMLDARFFPDAKLNFAENLLHAPGSGDALIFHDEDYVSSRMTWEELLSLVSRLQQALRACGVCKGDRVAAMMPNLPETIALMLAVTSLGAIFSSCSPDFGEHGVLDRFGQIEPKVFVSVDGYLYNRKLISITGKVAAVANGLASAAIVLIVPGLSDAGKAAAQVPRALSLEDFIDPYSAKPLTFERLPFDHPVYILFSSGTTGVPKCIVHGAGGTLLQHFKEHRLHCDLRPGERLFYFTTCSWMMWNWLASGIGSGATLVLYEGSPFAPLSVLWDLADQDGINVFGTSAKYLDACRKQGLAPARSHELSGLRMIASTGSPLAAEGFDYVYSDVKSDGHLASISGGTDIISCFVLGDPTSPVWRGEIQAPGLGMAVDVWSEDGKPVRQQKGELVCTKPFPSMPVMFWNDPESRKYHAAYFERFPGVWCHGDFAEWTTHGGMIIHGRSDATLNPGGVRLGTAEIYAQVEQIPEVLEGVAVGQDWDNDVRVVLFVRLAEGVILDDTLRETIRKKIRFGATPRHVPAKIVQIADIPRTKSGKISELAVRDVIHGRPVKNTDALANPEALDLYRELPELSA
jgi:acetoacetyl-CoA synthetase